MLVLFAFGLLLLLFDFIPFGALRFGAEKTVCQSLQDCDNDGKGARNTEDVSAALSPRLAFFLGRPMAINQATLQDLTLLPGIGEQLAGRIIEFRDKRGGIHKGSDLEQIPGIGSKIRHKISGFVTFSQP